MLWLGLLLVSGAVEPPTTVNGEVLGTPDEYRTDGPATVCIRNMAVEAKAGETIYLGYAGIHSGSLRLMMGSRSIQFTHGNSWAKPKNARYLTERRTSGTIYRMDENGAIRYIAYNVNPVTGKDKPLVMIGGDALSGRKTDIALLDRMTIAEDDFPNCDRTYSYGWSMLLGEEKLSEQKKP